MFTKSHRSHVYVSVSNRISEIIKLNNLRNSLKVIVFFPDIGVPWTSELLEPRSNNSLLIPKYLRIVNLRINRFVFKLSALIITITDRRSLSNYLKWQTGNFAQSLCTNVLSALFGGHHLTFDGFPFVLYGHPNRISIVWECAANPSASNQRFTLGLVRSTWCV